ncbi:MAG: protein translocase subunit SecF [Elusimicrobiales bacterium]|jgi:preprotein translocase subunit SecF|nr:protein translocase subunit SecF [Elusimicrobiales bacterium]
MVRLIPKTNIDFVGKRHYFYAISSIIILIGIIYMFVKGLNLGLDFTGGTQLQLKFNDKTDIGSIRKALNKNQVEAQIISFGDNSYSITVKGDQENVNEYANKITNALNSEGFKFIEEKRDFVGPVVGKDLSRKAIFSIVLSMFGIIVYVAFRYTHPIWGLTGVIGIIHDVLVAITALLITGRQIDLVIIAALLTIAGYSINDTIVIYDRIRENIRKFPKKSFGELINLSINETLSRTIVTSSTVIFVLLVLYFFGGSAINDFAFCMLAGSVCGVYSTLGICTTLAYDWQKEK